MNKEQDRLCNALGVKPFLWDPYLLTGNRMVYSHKPDVMFYGDEKIWRKYTERQGFNEERTEGYLLQMRKKQGKFDELGLSKEEEVLSLRLAVQDNLEENY